MHEKTELPEVDQLGISKNFAELYRLGHSIPEISRLTGVTKTTIRDSIVCASKTYLLVSKDPYYGFCYFQGKIVPDPREYENLLFIHRMWRAGTNPNRVATKLNAKRIAARSASAWNRNSVVLILERFEKGIISIKGDKYELR